MNTNNKKDRKAMNLIEYSEFTNGVALYLLRINKFLEISPSTAFQARAVKGRLLCLRRLENALRVPL